MSFVEKEEYYEFKEEMRKAINELERNTTEKIHRVELVNEKVLVLLESMDSKLETNQRGQEEQAKTQKSMEMRMDDKLDSINESIVKVNESVHTHSVSIAVLQEDRMAKPIVALDSKTDDKKISVVTEYKKQWIAGILAMASGIGIALVNNAEPILRLLGVGK